MSRCPCVRAKQQALKTLLECRRMARDVIGMEPARLSQKQQGAVNVWRAFKTTGCYEYTVFWYSQCGEGRRESVYKFHFELD